MLERGKMKKEKNAARREKNAAERGQEGWDAQMKRRMARVSGETDAEAEEIEAEENEGHRAKMGDSAAGSFSGTALYHTHGRSRPKCMENCILSIEHRQKNALNCI